MRCVWISRYLRLGLASVLVMGGAIASLGDCAFAQIQADGTVGTTVLPCTTDCTIQGGTQVGNNLFHSFFQFSVPTNGSAFFNNGDTIENIISRVTGPFRSDIDGLLRANGTANLFLMNPNGIIFGPNATLSLGGSFVATTADGIGFGDQFTFSASAQNVPPVTLTVAPSVFVFNQAANQQPSSLQVNGADLTVGNLSNSPTLLLVGGNVLINNRGKLQGFDQSGSDIQIGAFTGTGRVPFNNQLRLELPENGFPDGLEGAEVSLNNAVVNTGSTNTDAGNISIAGGMVSLTNSSQISSSTFGSGNAGSITLRADSIFLNDNSNIFSTAVGSASGNAGNIIMNAREGVSIKSSSIIGTSGNSNTSTFNAIRIRVSEGAVNLNQANLNTNNSGSGYAGDIVITARDEVAIDNRSNISSQGLAGRILIGENSIDSNFSNFSPRSVRINNASRLTTNNTGSGDAGNIEIRSEHDLFLDNQSRIDSNSLVSGQGGNISISTGSLVVMRRNSIIETNASSQGTGGNITITTGALAAIPVENSDISANANDGSGGFIEINARGVLGLRVRRRNTEKSDITAISQQRPELNGVVVLNTDIDLSTELGKPPEAPVDVSQLIAQGCIAPGDRRPSRLRRTGDPNNLPSNPVEELGSQKPTSGQQAFVEAQGWIRDSNNKGVLYFVAQPSTGTPYSPSAAPATCDGF